MGLFGVDTKKSQITEQKEKPSFENFERKLDDVHVIIIGARGLVVIGNSVYCADNVSIFVERHGTKQQN